MAAAAGDGERAVRERSAESVNTAPERGSIRGMLPLFLNFLNQKLKNEDIIKPLTNGFETSILPFVTNA